MAGIEPNAHPRLFWKPRKAVLAKGFKAFKLDPFGTAQGFISREELDLSYAICRMLRDRLPRDTRILIDVHARFSEIAALMAAKKFADLDIYWWEEPTSRDRQETVHEVAHRSPIPVATGEMYDTVGQFYTLAAGGGVNIFQPEPMSLGGIGPALQVANLAFAHGSHIAPHQSGGPVATAVCLQLAAAVPNFLIQEHFDAFNDDWTRELVTWHPTIDRANGHLSLPDAPGLGIDLNIDAIKQHPYDPHAYLNVHAEGWEKRLGRHDDAKAGDSQTSGAFPIDDLETETGDRGDLRLAAEPRKQDTHGTAAHLVAVDPHRRQRRPELRGEVHVAIAGDANPVGNFPFAAVAFLDGADRQRIAGEEDGVDVLVAVRQRDQRFGSALCGDRHLHFHAGVVLDAKFRERRMIADAPLLQPVIAMNRR